MMFLWNTVPPDRNYIEKNKENSPRRNGRRKTRSKENEEGKEI
jgi:hypothetical protein